MSNEYFDVAPTRGNLSFTASSPATRSPTSCSATSSAPQLTNVFVVTQQLQSQSFFGQDDWRASDKLTVNLGHALRLHGAGDGEGQPDGQLRSGRDRPALVFAEDGSLEDRALVNPDRNNFAPRVGAVYKVNDRTHRPRRLSASSTTCSSASARRISSRSIRPGC